MTAAPIVDLESRQLGQVEFDRPLAVEAGAGTGKTTVLVARILAWCLGRGWKETLAALNEDAELSGADQPALDDQTAQRVLSGVVAITFTEAAAAQMASRVAQSLAHLAAHRSHEVIGFDPALLPDEPALDVIAHRARALVGALDHLRVRTIHSHCWHLLTSYSMAARVSPDLRIDADGREVDQIVREVVESAAKKAYVDSRSTPLGRLARRHLGPSEIAEAAQLLIADGVQSQAFDQDPLSAEQLQALRSDLLRRLLSVQSTAAPLSTAGRAKKAQEILQAVTLSIDVVASCPETPDLIELNGLFNQIRTLWDEGLMNHLRKWSRDDLNKTEADVLGEDRRSFATQAAALYSTLRLCLRCDLEVLDAGRRVLGPILQQVELELRSRGVATYNSLLVEAWRLLTDNPGVRKRERARIRQLLVDEFQDTDRLQCDLVRLLALDERSDNGPGLFVVGDPKQSIYGWRNADLGAYDAFKSALLSAGGETLVLRQNFRSVPAVLEEVERVIAPIMKAKSGIQPRFEKLIPHRVSRTDCQNPDPVASVEYWVSWNTQKGTDEKTGAATSAARATEIEAQAVATDIARLHQEQQTPWNKFGLLFRSTSQLEVYLDAFRELGVPFVVTSDKHYFKRREIIDIAALIRCVVNPVDHIALVTYLRSPSVGVPDGALLPLWRRKLPELLTHLDGPDHPDVHRIRDLVLEVSQQLPDDIPGIDRIRGWEDSAIAAIDNLAILRQSLARDPADRFVELLRNRSLIEVTEAARFLGSYRLANLQSFFQRLERSLDDHNGDFQAVLRMLRRSVAEIEEADQALPEGASEAGVQVMTIHKAKGLEFDHVYLVQLHASTRANEVPTIRFDRRWIPGNPAEYILFGSPTPGFESTERRDQEIDGAEKVRTLYVAMTRAKERLVMIGNWPNTPATIPKRQPASYIDLLIAGRPLPDSFDELLARCRQTKETRFETESALWKFPDLESGKPPIQVHQFAPVGSSAAAHRRQAKQLSKHRTAAREHMKRASSATASSEAAIAIEPMLAESRFDNGAPGVSRMIGESFHRMMETWRFDSDPDEELARQRLSQLEWLDRSVLRAAMPKAQERFVDLVDRFHQGQLWHRFLALGDQIVARELPVVLPPRDPNRGPLGYVSGSIDLLIRDPETGRVVVVDYKTDPIESEQELVARARAYSRQERVYSRAIEEALSLDQPPRQELWFIWADQVWDDAEESPAS